MSCCSSQADLSINLQDDSNYFYGVSSQYESSDNMIITSSTKVCSFGKQVVEKVEVRKRKGTKEKWGYKRIARGILLTSCYELCS